MSPATAEVVLPGGKRYSPPISGNFRWSVWLCFMLYLTSGKPHLDSLVTVFYVNKQRCTRSQPLMRDRQRIMQWVEKNVPQISAVYIRGSENFRQIGWSGNGLQLRNLLPDHRQVLCPRSCHYSFQGICQRLDRLFHLDRPLSQLERTF